MITDTQMEKSIFTREYKLFLKLLKSERISRNISQLELGKLIGQTQSFISKCERGERRLDLVEVQRICDVLNISFSSFAKKYEESLKKVKRNG